MITNTSIGRYGRFGNMLFQIAAVVGIARKSGQSYGFDPIVNIDHRDRFGSKEDCDLEKYFAYEFPRIDKSLQFREYAYSWGYHDIWLPPNTGNWDISGHFQSDKYFAHCIDEVRALLTMKGEPDLQENTVAVHIRRGDYDDNYHTILREEYYRPALALFPAGMTYWVFSDDPAAAAELMEKCGVPAANMQIQVHDYLTDFKYMKNCRHFICANSSYSLMAAILSRSTDKRIVCPRKWFGPAWIPTTADLYPQGSITI